MRALMFECKTALKFVRVECVDYGLQKKSDECFPLLDVRTLH